MSALWTSDAAVAATGGKTTCAWSASGVSIDSRSLARGDLFVALTDQRDGHDFVQAALDAGAAAALVSRIPQGVSRDAPLLVVDDVLEGLQGLARAARQRFQGKVIGVTGSVGKTGTKEMIRVALKGQGRIHAAERSFNNHWGVPLTLARMAADTDFAIIEMGMNHAGEIGPLSRLARPDVALITTIAPAHMAAFRNIREVARAKAEIFEGVPEGGVAILPRDNRMYPVLSRAAKKAGLQQFRFGWTGRPEFWMRRNNITSGATAVLFRYARQNHAAKISAPGKHLGMNALGALAAIEAVGADLGRAIISLADWQPPSGRGNRVEVHLGTPQIDGSILLIDESYNANPASMKAALDVLAASAPDDGVGRIGRGRRIAILGDMLELGDSEAEDHAGLCKLDAMETLDKVHTVGTRMAALRDALPAELRGVHAKSSKALAKDIDRLLDAGDVVMVKGSLGTGLKTVVNAIEALGRPLDPTKTETP